MYPFHPRCGERVLVQRRFAYRGVDLVVIPQPDGSIACIPEWMTHERAARFKLATVPQFSLENLSMLRIEIDALLACLPSDSKREPDGYEAKQQKARKAAAGTVRSSGARCGPATDPAGLNPGNRRADGVLKLARLSPTRSNPAMAIGACQTNRKLAILILWLSRIFRFLQIIRLQLPPGSPRKS